MRGLQGKRVLISGGSSGIGLATARRFLEEGSRVFLAGLDQREVDAALAGLGPSGEVSGLACDVSGEGDVARMVAAAHRALGGSTSSSTTPAPRGAIHSCRSRQVTGTGLSR